MCFFSFCRTCLASLQPRSWLQKIYMEMNGAFAISSEVIDIYVYISNIKFIAFCGLVVLSNPSALGSSGEIGVDVIDYGNVIVDIFGQYFIVV